MIDMFTRLKDWIKRNKIPSALAAILATLATVAAIASPIRDYFGWESNRPANSGGSDAALLAVSRPQEEEKIFGCMAASGTGAIPAGKTLWVSHRTIRDGKEVGPYYTFRQAHQAADGKSWETERFDVGEDGREQRFLVQIFLVPGDLVPFMSGVISGGGKALADGGNLSSNSLPPYIEMVRQVKILRPAGSCPG